MTDIANSVLTGDCLEVLSSIPDESINLIVTSPPYADSRKSTYGGISPNEYVSWFLPRANQFRRVLKPNGTFILNIKEKVQKSERHTYVIELILELRKQGWLWTEEFIWHKKTSMPGKWPNRFRDAWERVLQFNKNKMFVMNQDSVMIPVGSWVDKRLKKSRVDDLKRQNSSTSSGFGRNISRWKDKQLVYPTNVLHMSPENRNKQHSAVFPYAFPEWFIKVFSNEQDIVLDPFAGSGTTLIASKNLKRRFVGIEILEQNVRIIHERLTKNTEIPND